MATISLNYGWTVTINDPNGILNPHSSSITKDLNYVVDTLNKYISFKVPLDISIAVQPESANPYGVTNGLIPATGVQNTNIGGVLKPVSMVKGQTGVDLNSSGADLGFTIYLGTDGTLRNYGMPLWFDPNPQLNSLSSLLPSGSSDFTSIALHELMHCLGFATSTDPSSPSIWNANTFQKDGVWYFSSPAVLGLLGQPLPLQSTANTSFKTALDHVGNTFITNQPIRSDLMYTWGNYQLNRWQMGQVDLVVLQSLGWNIQNYQNLPLTDPFDTANITATAPNQTLYASSQSSVITTSGGNNKIILPTAPGNGNYLINGGSGINTVIEGKSISLFNLVPYAGQFLLQCPSGIDSVSLLNGVQRVVFTDGAVALDIGKDQTAGSGYMLYKAAFNRTPDAGGLGYWISKMDTGMSYSSVAQNFVNSAEFKTAFGGANPSVNTLVTKLYNNVLNRTPDAGGLAFWQNKLSNEGWTTADVLGFFSTSGENVTNVTPLIANGIQYQQFVGSV